MPPRMPQVVPQGSKVKVSPAKLEWERLSYRVRDKQVLKNCSGIAHPGEVVALMGPSGAGKTSLLDLVARRIDPLRRGREVTGEVRLNEKKLTSGGFGKMAVYVQQEDALVGVLTVREVLFNGARLAGVPTTKVDPMIDRLGLRSAEHTMVGNIFMKGISGGQKRRLSLAEQLLTEPSLLLLDEPTSGLDSASALAVVTLLCELSHDDGCTVVCTIHQPASEIWALFDKVCFMVDGRVCYFGAAGEAVVNYFAELGHPCPPMANPSDFILGLINKDFPGHADTRMLTERWKVQIGQERTNQADEPPAFGVVVRHGGEDEDVIIAPPRSRAIWPVRLLVLLWRDAREILRDPGIIVVRLVMYSMLSFLIGGMFYGLEGDDEDEDISARVSIIFYVAAFMVFMSVAVLPFFMIQREVFVKERFNGSYGVSEYVLSKWLVSVPGVFLITIVSCGIIIGMTGMNGFWIYTVCLFLSLMFAEAFMAFMAACVPHYIIGIALGAGVFGFFMLCQGFFKVKDDIPDYLYWGYVIAPHSYSFRVFMHNEFSVITGLNSSLFANGTDVLEFYDMDDVCVDCDLRILMYYAIGFQLAFGAVLFFFHTGKR
mmetsp:Transcript_20406/g.52694  ORF Transcript_20406/g.52694 Transcript_20406/m.52694 type:complete len:600 (+) Transcript_20406:91-1890(+)